MSATGKKQSITLGEKLKKIRSREKISLEQLAKDTNKSVEYLKNVESGENIPPVGVLLQLSKALKIDSAYLLKDTKKSLAKRKDAYDKRSDNYAYTNLSPDSEKRHLKAFKVSIEPMQDHSGVGYQHEGEEFIFVLKGEVEIMVGRKKTRLQSGASIHFDSEKKHFIKNISQKKAELLVVLYTP